MVQRPHAPFDERLKRVFVCVISRDVAESPRLTLDALGAGAKMVTDNDEAVKEALDLLRLTSVKGKGVRGESSGTKRGEVKCPVTEPGPEGTCPLCPQVCRAGHGFTPF